MSHYRKRQRRRIYPIVESLRVIRAQRGISRKLLAHKIGCGYFTLVKWENGMCLPSLQALYDWSRALGAELIIDDEPADPLGDCLHDEAAVFQKEY
jgi:DNA-binding XRE family transcriptional regulator